MAIPTQVKAAQVIKSRSPRVSWFHFLGSHIVLVFDDGTDCSIPQHEWQPLAKEWTPDLHTAYKA